MEKASTASAIARNLEFSPLLMEMKQMGKYLVEFIIFITVYDACVCVHVL